MILRAFFCLICLVWSVTVQARVIDTPRTEAIRTLIVEAAYRYHVPPGLALAVGHVESFFRADVTSSAGARGVMQIMPATAQGEFGVSADRLFNAALNVDLGVRFLRQLYDTYGRWDIALSHYNGGSRVRLPNGRLQIIPATRDYVRKVMRLKSDYAATVWMYGGTRHPLNAQALGAGQQVYRTTLVPTTVRGRTSNSRRSAQRVAISEMEAALADLNRLLN